MHRIFVLVVIFALSLTRCSSHKSNSDSGGSNTTRSSGKPLTKPTPSAKPSPSPSPSPVPKVVTLTWAAPFDKSQQGYTIEQSTDQKNFTVIQSVDAKATSASVANLTEGTTYFFRIQAFNDGGKSSYSQILTVKL